MADKEYIERGALLMTPPFTKYGGDLSAYTEGYLDCAEEARKAVNDAPAADVVEVRHGEWKQTCVPDVFQCTSCKRPTKMDELCDSETLRAYCPNCGAKMDGKREDNS